MFHLSSMGCYVWFIEQFTNVWQQKSFQQQFTLDVLNTWLLLISNRSIFMTNRKKILPPVYLGPFSVHYLFISTTLSVHCLCLSQQLFCMHWARNSDSLVYLGLTTNQLTALSMHEIMWGWGTFYYGHNHMIVLSNLVIAITLCS